MNNMDVSDIFFSDKNIDFLYSMVSQDVEKRTQYDISRHKSNQKNFTKMINLVYQKTSSSNRNLTYLNRRVLDKTIPYFINLIQKKRNNNNNTNHLNATRPVSSNATFENNLQMSITHKKDLQGELDQIIADRNQVNSKPNPQDTRQMFEMPVESNNNDMKVKYQEIVQSRENFGGATSTRNPIRQTNMSDSISNNNPQYHQLSRGIVNNNVNNNNVNNTNNVISPNQGTNSDALINILPFSMSNNFSNNMSNVDSPLYQNMATLEQNENKDPMELYQQYQNTRDQESTNYMKIQQQQRDNTNEGVNNLEPQFQQNQSHPNAFDASRIGVDDLGYKSGSISTTDNGLQQNKSPGINNHTNHTNNHTNIIDYSAGEGLSQRRNQVELEAITNATQVDPSILYKLNEKINKDMMDQIGKQNSHTDLLQHIANPLF